MEKLTPQIKLGSILLTLLEPELGHEQQFHRWYERDHFYAGCMIGANFFSGRRWVATRELKDLRFPSDTPVTEDIRKGSYLASYWILDQQYDEALSWSIAQVLQLHSQKRMDPPRENITTGFYNYQWGAFRDENGVPAELALEHPYRGVAMTFIDLADKIASEALAENAQATLSPVLDVVMRDSNCAITLCLAPLPLPDKVPAYVPGIAPEILAKRRLLLHFFDQSPELCWPQFTEQLLQQLSQQQSQQLPQQQSQKKPIAKIVYAAPFIPTIPGTDAYVDEF